jgi:hypothetical protein
MFHKEFPRVYELRELIEDPSVQSAYFQDFENSIRSEPEKKEAWLAWEQELQGLDAESWKFLKSKMLPHLAKRDPSGRGWQQLITILNQARAYNFLLRVVGCSSVRFIPESKRETPDLQGELDFLKVLCEVKTINISEDEVLARQDRTARTITDRLGPGFFKKLMLDLKKAKEQITSYDSSPNVRQNVYIITNFDDLLAEYKERYYHQIDQYFADHPTDGFEIVFHNQKSCFHKPITMKYAIVFNEAD